MKRTLVYFALLMLTFILIIKYNMPQYEYIAPGLPKFGVKALDEIKQYPPTIKLLDHNDRFFCTGFVIDDNYAITAAHCLDDSGPRKNIKVYTEGNVYTKVVAQTAAFNKRMDYGLIKGNFKSFTPADLDLVLQTVYTENVSVACGYPMGVKNVICYQVKLIGNNYFGVSAAGFLFPGMSGGPVVNMVTGKVFALNSRVDGGFVVISPLVGILAAFGIEP